MYLRVSKSIKLTHTKQKYRILSSIFFICFKPSVIFVVVLVSQCDILGVSLEVKIMVLEELNQ